MMNSKEKVQPETFLENTLNLLSETRISILVDEPINRASQTFNIKIKTPISHSGFNRIITEFVCHLYEKGLRLPRLLTDHQEALAEAVYLLKRGYPGDNNDGYDQALFDSTNYGMEGIETVLSSLAELIKNAEREKYMKSIFVENFDRLDFFMQLEIVSVYQKRFANIIPPQIRDIKPASLVDLFHKLIMDHISDDSLMIQAWDRILREI